MNDLQNLLNFARVYQLSLSITKTNDTYCIRIGKVSFMSDSWAGDLESIIRSAILFFIEHHKEIA